MGAVHLPLYFGFLIIGLVHVPQPGASLQAGLSGNNNKTMTIHQYDRFNKLLMMNSVPANLCSMISENLFRTIS